MIRVAQGDSNQIGLEKTPDEYVSSILAVMREVWRVLKDDGVLWLNLGDSYATGTTAGRQDGTLNLGKGTEAARKIARIGTPQGIKTKDLVGIPWRVAFALQADGWYLRSDIIWSKPNPMPESVKDRPTKAHEYIFLLSKSERYFFDSDAVKEAAKMRDDERPFGNAGGARHGDEGRVYTNGKWSGEGKQSSGRRMVDSVKTARNNGAAHDNPFGSTRNIRSVWQIATNPYSGAHFATFPREIPELCTKAGSKPGDVVLDPFCGSGTTVMVAQDLGRIGIGLDLTYQNLAAERIGGSLFKGVVNSAWA